MKILHYAIPALAAVVLLQTPAAATTEGICYNVVHVASWDVLNIRARRSARSRIVGEIPPRRHGIIALIGSCRPFDVAPGSRWCQIAYHDGDYTVRGFVKRRFLRETDCP